MGIRPPILTGPPRIKVGKKSEHASEGEFVKLICKSEASHPPVDEWVWFKTSDTGDQVRAKDMELERYQGAVMGTWGSG